MTLLLLLVASAAYLGVIWAAAEAVVAYTVRKGHS